MNYESRLQESHDLLTFVLDRINILGNTPNRDEYFEYDSALEKLEMMLMVHNIFSETPLLLSEDGSDNTFSLEYM